MSASSSDPGTATLGEILRRARTHRNLTLREVEDRTQISNAHLSQIERGVIRRPNPILLLTLSDLYNLNYELLAQSGGYLDENAEASSDRILETVMRSFVRLDSAGQHQVLREIEALGHARRSSNER